MVDEPQPVAVRRHVHDGHRRRSRPGPRVRHGQHGLAKDAPPDRAPARPGSAAGTRRPGRPRHRPSGSPSARASASTTSASPPVLAHGSHSAARKATRSPIAPMVARGSRARCGALVRLNRFTWPPRTGIMRPHGPRLRPVDPGGQLSPATPTRRPPPPRLQPPMGLGSADPEPVEPHRPDGLEPLPQPDPGHQRPDGVVPPPRRREVPGRVPRRPGRVRPLHGRRLRPLVPPQARRQARRPDRLLLRRVRHPRVARHLLGRPRASSPATT